ncbi:MAG: GTP-binding protein, partial [Pseudonocardia sp.]
MARTLNLGILAHVDAGKTSLTERLLHDAGVIDEIGRVDHGSTRTDSSELERRRGITIRSGVVSFTVDAADGPVTVNLIDTPGHPDFIAEVERVLSVLDGAVLVVSAVEGVQAQTRVLLRTLRRLRIPTLIFVNKTDRRGADPERVFREITTRLAPAVRADLTNAVETLAEYDDALLAAYVDGTPVDT